MIDNNHDALYSVGALNNEDLLVIIGALIYQGKHDQTLNQAQKMMLADLGRWLLPDDDFEERAEILDQLKDVEAFEVTPNQIPENGLRLYIHANAKEVTISCDHLLAEAIAMATGRIAIEITMPPSGSISLLKLSLNICQALNGYSDFSSKIDTIQRCIKQKESITVN
jgi:hypothetical protein